MPGNSKSIISTSPPTTKPAKRKWGGIVTRDSPIGKVRKSRRRAVRRESSFGNSEYGLKKRATFGTLSLWGLACSTRLIQRIPVQAMTGIGSPTEAKTSYIIPPSHNLKALIKEIYRTAQAGNGTQLSLSRK